MGTTMFFLGAIWECDLNSVSHIFFYLILFFLNHFDVLMLKIIFKNLKIIILMFFCEKYQFEKQLLPHHQTHH